MKKIYFKINSLSICRAGVVLIGGIAVDTSFVKSQIELSAIIDTQLNLQSDIDFSSNVKVCMRLNQPNMMFR